MRGHYHHFSMSTTFRSDRAAEAVRAAVTKVLREEVQDPGLGFVTVTSCEMSRDLQNAKVYYTVLGDAEAQHSAHAAFNRATPFLRSRVGEEVGLRTVPELIFRYDRSTDNAMRIEEILASLPDLHRANDEMQDDDSKKTESDDA